LGLINFWDLNNCWVFDLVYFIFRPFEEWQFGGCLIYEKIKLMTYLSNYFEKNYQINQNLLDVFD